MPKHKSKSKTRDADIFAQAYDELTARIKDRQFKASDLIHLATVGMEIAETYVGLSGPQKRDLVVRLVERLIQDYAPEESQELLLSSTQLLLPSIIDQIVAASKGQLGLNLDQLIKSGGCGCFGK